MEEIPDKTGEIDIVKLMEERLPPYVVRCFLAAGYDTPEVISSMDIRENESNCINVIESFIQKYYAGNREFYSDMVPDMQHPFVFSPGHRVRICSFISEVKHKYCANQRQDKHFSSIAPQKSKFRASSKPRSKQRDSDTEPESGELTISSVSNQVRSSISKWVKNQPTPEFKCLKENKHFIILVSRVPKSSLFSDSIRCIPCNVSLQLSLKNKTYLISNWTRHVRSCGKLKKSQKQGTKQHSLNMFLSPVFKSGTSTCSSPLCDDSSLFVESTGSFIHSVADLNETSSSTLNSIDSVLMSPNTQPTDSSLTEDCGADRALNTIDWSRDARRKRKLEQVSDDVEQTYITDFFSILDDIDRLAIENKRLASLLEQATKQDQSCDEPTSPSSLTAVLRQIILNAQANTTCLPTGRRHPEVLKNFCTSLLIYAGPLAYNFLQENLPHALPSLRSVRRVLHSEYKVISEGQLRIDELVTHLLQYKAPNVVSIGEDATRLISRVEWDPESNRCCGFVLPINEKGLPEVDSFWP